MKARPSFAALALSASLLATPGHATIFTFYNNLTGAQENPPVASPGTGTALITYDDAIHTMRVQVTFSGLVANTTASHIHIAATVGGNGSVATQTPTFAGFPLGVTSGSYDMTFDMSSASSYNPAFVTANGGSVVTAESAFLLGLKEGRGYLNVHSAQFGGGEIRANLLAAPEPASWAMMVGGFGLLGAALRRRNVARAIA